MRISWQRRRAQAPGVSTSGARRLHLKRQGTAAGLPGWPAGVRSVCWEMNRRCRLCSSVLPTCLPASVVVAAHPGSPCASRPWMAGVWSDGGLPCHRAQLPSAVACNVQRPFSAFGAMARQPAQPTAGGADLGSGLGFQVEQYRRLLLLPRLVPLWRGAVLEVLAAAPPASHPPRLLEVAPAARRENSCDA